MQFKTEEMRQILTAATPGTKIAYLFLFLLIGLITAGTLIPLILLIPGLSNGGELTSIYVGAAIQSVFAIALPAFFIAALTHPAPTRYLKIGKSGRMTEKVILALLLFLFSYLFASFLSQWNKGISLPQSLSGIEQAMRSMEDAALETTDLLLSVDTIGGLLLNLLIVAGFAALSEELFFRGALQQLLQEKFRNGHAAVWVAAFIFSIVHFQFYGFLPRLFLGALLGYLFLYTRNLWIPILFHFINNATVLVISYFWRDAGWLRKMEEMPVTLPFVAGAVASLLLTFLLFWSYNKKTATRSKPTDNSV